MTSLRSIPALRTLPQAVLEATTVQARPVRYPAGAVIRPAGQRAAGVVLLLSGTVVATHPTPIGTEVWSDRWTTPRILDKPAVLADDMPSYGLMALTTATARLLPAEGFNSLLEGYPSVRAHVLGHLARDTLAVRERLVQAVALSATSQVAAWLNAQDPTSGVVWRGSQEHLARLLGLRLNRSRSCRQ